MFKNLNHSALGVVGHQSEIIELALTYRFGGMDLDVAEFATRAKLHGMPYARRLIDSAKIRLGSFQLPLAWNTEDGVFRADLEKLPGYAEVAVEVGCTRCLATLSPACDTRPYHENFEFHRDRFSQIAQALQPVGVRFGVGFQAAEYLRKDRAFQFVHDLDALTLLVNMIDTPNMGMLLDVWDLVACGGSAATIRSLPLEQIVAVQVAEMSPDVAAADLDEKSRLLPDAENGRVNVASMLTTLGEMGYDGPVTVIPSQGIFHTRRREVVVKQTAEALGSAWKAAGLGPDGKLVAPVAPVAPAVEAVPAAPAEG
ncbi:MAG: sugar phosphate isomerase/epimerase [Candidatus Nealsonbacteria bacterium]|nr:sugar phosphate isomerase/epimerase [Candidatus Nealsonbacteria bacterium]